MQEISSCPICQGNKFIPFLNCKDYLVSQQIFTIQQCQQCSFKFTSPRPSNDAMGQFYKSDQYVSHNDQSRGIINVLYRLVRQYTLKSKVSLINKLYNGQGRLLDIGCGTGSFLEAARQGGWQIAGLEPDADARTLAEQRLNVKVGEGINDLTKTTLYNVITLWHVLEHVLTLDITLQAINQQLEADGILLLALPNNASWDAKHYAQYWAAYDVPRHLHHFTPETISKLLGMYGFRLHSTKPMYFDSFYISMLSAGYRDGKPNLIEGLINGIRSNWKAHKTHQYSSLIYIFKKG